MVYDGDRTKAISVLAKRIEGNNKFVKSLKHGQLLIFKSFEQISKEQEHIQLATYFNPSMAYLCDKTVHFDKAVYADARGVWNVKTIENIEGGWFISGDMLTVRLNED